MMRKTSTLRALCCGCGLAIFLAWPCYAQKERATQTVAATAVQVSMADAAELVNGVKAVESPAFRAYLYARAATWLWQAAGDDPALRQLAADAAAAGVADIHRHESEIPPAPAAGFYNDLLTVARKQSPEAAERLERSYPLKTRVNLSGGEKAGLDFYAATDELAGPRPSAEAVEKAIGLINSGGVPVSVLHGEILRLDELKSPTLPRLLDAALSLEERRAGALPLQNMFFLSHIYLRDDTPAQIRLRFLSATLNATRLSQPEVANNSATLTWAVQLLRNALPVMQRVAPSLQAEAAARLAALSPAAASVDDVYSRIEKSSDPLAATISEANFTSDKRLKQELLRSAARLARQRGKLRQAAELMASVEEERAGLPEGYSARDEFLRGLLQDALAKGEVETASFIASKVGLDVNRAAAHQALARHFLKAQDHQSAEASFAEALKALKDAPEGKEKAVQYLRLTADSVALGDGRDARVAAEAVKAINSIAYPREDPEGKFSWSLFPLTEAVTKTFQQLSRKDRAGALGLSNAFQQKELKLASRLGVYASPQN